MKTEEKVKQFVKEWMEGHEPDTFVKNKHGVCIFSAGHSSINLTMFFEDLLQDYIDSTIPKGGGEE